MKRAELEAYLDENAYLAHDGGYDYITRIPVYSLTLDKVVDLEANAAAALAELEALRNKAVEELWMEELDEFLAAYEVFETAAGASGNSTGKSVKTKAVKATK
jgi:DNA topoisomerase-2